MSRRAQSLLVAFGLFAATPAAAIELCSGAVRVTCVVDGDTVWLDGEKIRLAGIDAPEKDGSCAAERQLAARAAGRLVELLSAGGAPSVERQGLDKYRRTLAALSVAGRDVGATLVDEGLARRWQGHKERWCW